MKAWIWLLLTILALPAGCAQGYHPSDESYWQPQTESLYSNPFTNPETEEEEQNRIWSEDAGR